MKWTDMFSSKRLSNKATITPNACLEDITWISCWLHPESNPLSDKVELINWEKYWKFEIVNRKSKSMTVLFNSRFSHRT